MLCLNCRNHIVIKRNILNLFSLKREYICLECLNKINFNPTEIILPIDNDFIKIYYLLEDSNDFKYDSLINESSKIYSKLNKTFKLILNLNRFYLCEKNYLFLEQLSKHHNHSIYIFVYEMFD